MTVPCTELKVRHQPKSKRLSSLIWIGAIWLLVRLIAELDGISWTRSFWSGATWLGAIPATYFLLISIFFSDRSLTKVLRWTALICAVSSFTGLFVIPSYTGDERSAIPVLRSLQLALSITISIGVSVWYVMKPRNEA